MISTPRTNRGITFVGLGTALLFICGPFMYAIIFGRGLFLYIAAVYIGAILLQAAKNSGRLSYHWDKIVQYYMLLALWQTITFIWSPARNGANLYEFSKIILIVFLVIIQRFSDQDRNLMLLSQTVVAVVAVFVMQRTGSQFAGVGNAANRSTFDFFGVTQDPNYMCYFIVAPCMYLFAAVLEGARGKKILRVISWILCAYLVYGVLSTGSRGGLMGIAIGILTYLLFRKRIGTKSLLALLALTMIASIGYDLVITVLPQSIVNRYTMENMLADGGSGRLTIWGNYFTHLLSNPFYFFFGTGAFSCETVMFRSAHNYIIEVAFEYGIVGLVLHILFFGRIIKAAKKSQNWIALSIVVATLVIGLTLSVSRMLQFWLAIIMAIAQLGEGSRARRA